MVRRGDTDRVDALVIEQLPHVRKACDLAIRFLLQGIRSLAEYGLIDVTKGCDLDPRQLLEAGDMRLPAALHADDGQADRVIRPGPGGLETGAERHRASARTGHSQEITSVHRFHGYPSP